MADRKRRRGKKPQTAAEHAEAVEAILREHSDEAPPSPAEAELTLRQVAALEVVLTASSVRAASEKANVPARTLQRWLADPAFRRALSERRASSTAHAAGLLASFAGQMMARLIADCQSENAWLANTSARAGLALVFGSIANMDIADRLDRLEVLLREKAGSNTPLGVRHAAPLSAMPQPFWVTNKKSKATRRQER